MQCKVRMPSLDKQLSRQKFDDAFYLHIRVLSPEDKGKKKNPKE